MVLRRSFLLLHIVIILDFSITLHAFQEEVPGFHRRVQGRVLTQVSATNNPVITFASALLRRLPEPVDWNAYSVEIRNAFQLRSAICESNGHIYMPDPITAEDRDHCYEVGETPKKITVILREDIYLRGMKLPPIEFFFKIDGRCADDSNRERCEIHATSALCSACALPGEGTEMNDLVLCDACRFGQEGGRETTPFRVMASAKLWLRNVEIAGCKTEGSGGCIKVASGDRSVWRQDSNVAGQMTYLDVTNCVFRRGYAEGEGGAIMIQTGALAFLQDTWFSLNYAKAQGQTTQGQTASKSHDVMIQNYAAAVFIDCSPPALSVGQFFIVKMEEVIKGMEDLNQIVSSPPLASTRPSPPAPAGVIPAQPPPSGGSESPEQPPGGEDGSSTGSRIPIGVIVAIVIASVIAGSVSVLCCWWCFADPSKVGNDEDEEGMELGPKQKSMFVRITEKRGFARRVTQSWKTNFSSRFNSAFKSHMRDTEREGEDGETFRIPGTNKRYNTEQLMKGRVLNWIAADQDPDAGALPDSKKSMWKSGFGLKAAFQARMDATPGN